jgi:hypothetical protein
MAHAADFKARMLEKVQEQIDHTAITPNGKVAVATPDPSFVNYILAGFDPDQLKAVKNFIKSFPA